MVTSIIQPTADNVRSMQDVLRECDCMIQSTKDKVSAAAASIKLMLKEPDSPLRREHIRALCQVIQEQSYEAAQYVNGEAASWGADYVSEEELAELSNRAAAAGRLPVNSMMTAPERLGGGRP